MKHLPIILSIILLSYPVTNPHLILHSQTINTNPQRVHQGHQTLVRVIDPLYCLVC